MSKLDDALALVFEAYGEPPTVLVNQTKQQIKDLMHEVFETARDKGGRNEYELAAAFNEIVEEL